MDDYRAREASGTRKRELAEAVLVWASKVGEGLDDLSPEQRKEVLRMVVEEDGAGVERYKAQASPARQQPRFRYDGRMIVVLALAVVLLIVVGVWYFRAYKEAQEWPELQVFWGKEDGEQAGVLRAELEKQGVRVKVKALGGPDLFRMPGQRFTSVRVHRDDHAHAASIVRSLRGR